MVCGNPSFSNLLLPSLRFMVAVLLDWIGLCLDRTSSRVISFRIRCRRVSRTLLMHSLIFSRDLLLCCLMAFSIFVLCSFWASENCWIVLTSPALHKSTNLSAVCISIIKRLCLRRWSPKKGYRMKSFSSRRFWALVRFCCLICFFHILMNFHFLNCLKKLSSLIWL